MSITNIVCHPFIDCSIDARDYECLAFVHTTLLQLRPNDWALRRDASLLDAISAYRTTLPRAAGVDADVGQKGEAGNVIIRSVDGDVDDVESDDDDDDPASDTAPLTSTTGWANTTVDAVTIAAQDGAAGDAPNLGAIVARGVDPDVLVAASKWRQTVWQPRHIVTTTLMTSAGLPSQRYNHVTARGGRLSFHALRDDPWTALRRELRLAAVPRLLPIALCLGLETDHVYAHVATAEARVAIWIFFVAAVKAAVGVGAAVAGGGSSDIVASSATEHRARLSRATSAVEAALSRVTVPLCSISDVAAAADCAAGIASIALLNTAFATDRTGLGGADHDAAAIAAATSRPTMMAGANGRQGSGARPACWETTATTARLDQLLRHVVGHTANSASKSGARTAAAWLLDASPAVASAAPHASGRDRGLPAPPMSSSTAAVLTPQQAAAAACISRFTLLGSLLRLQHTVASLSAAFARRHSGTILRQWVAQSVAASVARGTTAAAAAAALPERIRLAANAALPAAPLQLQPASEESPGSFWRRVEAYASGAGDGGPALSAVEADGCAALDGKLKWAGTDAASSEAPSKLRESAAAAATATLLSNAREGAAREGGAASIIAAQAARFRTGAATSTESSPAVVDRASRPSALQSAPAASAPTLNYPPPPPSSADVAVLTSAFDVAAATSCAHRTQLASTATVSAIYSLGADARLGPVFDAIDACAFEAAASLLLQSYAAAAMTARRRCHAGEVGLAAVNPMSELNAGGALDCNSAAHACVCGRATSADATMTQGTNMNTRAAGAAFLATGDELWHAVVELADRHDVPVASVARDAIECLLQEAAQAEANSSTPAAIASVLPKTADARRRAQESGRSTLISTATAHPHELHAPSLSPVFAQTPFEREEALDAELIDAVVYVLSPPAGIAALDDIGDGASAVLKHGVQWLLAIAAANATFSSAFGDIAQAASSAAATRLGDYLQGAGADATTHYDVSQSPANLMVCYRALAAASVSVLTDSGPTRATSTTTSTSPPSASTLRAHALAVRHLAALTRLGFPFGGLSAFHRASKRAIARGLWRDAVTRAGRPGAFNVDVDEIGGVDSVSSHRAALVEIARLILDYRIADGSLLLTVLQSLARIADGVSMRTALLILSRAVADPTFDDVWVSLAARADAERHGESGNSLAALEAILHAPFEALLSDVRTISRLGESTAVDIAVNAALATLRLALCLVQRARFVAALSLEPSVAALCSAAAICTQRRGIVAGGATLTTVPAPTSNTSAHAMLLIAKDIAAVHPSAVHRAALLVHVQRHG